MSNPKQSNPARSDRTARAPYNFVPLPDQVVLAQDPPPHDRYDPALKTGRIVCTLTTLSSFYTRTALDPQAFADLAARLEGKDEEKGDLPAELKQKYAQFFHVGELERPLIPGSSLRGMVRALVEIVAHGHMRWVGNKPTFTFRAVAAAKDDPLRTPYEQALGRFGSKVKAGYLKRNGDEWQIEPALTPEEQGWPERRLSYLKVKETAISSSALPGFQRLRSPSYQPNWFPVRFDITTGHGKNGPYVAISQIGAASAGYRYQGALVCSGNMLETDKAGQPSPRKNHALVLARNPKRRPLRIPKQVVDDYLAGMTPFQRDELWGGKEWGCLKDGAPIFFVEGDNQTVTYFGHSPNFRIPAQLPGAARAATPVDFVPDELRKGDQPDLAEAIFGWVEQPAGQRAGRVFFSDARYVSASDGLWLRAESLPLHVLGTPKPTTFQHYLVQDKLRGHNPDERASLAHYGSAPSETQIRGYKLYWHKGSTPDIEATTKEREHPSQLTHVRPLKPGVTFQFDVRFENLRPEELGVLLWVLTLPGDANKRYAHKLGMGKPLGMGAVSLTAQLRIDDRVARYQRLFTEDGWQTAENAADPAPYLAACEQHLLRGLGFQTGRLAELPRMQALLALLEWREANAEWLQQTRYLEIEHAKNDNEYKTRPVLPDPLIVSRTHLTTSRAQPAQAPARPTLAPDERRGTVTRFGLGDNRSYGYIQPDDGGKEIFVHRSQLIVTGGSLLQGQRVRFKIRPGMKGREEAYDVRLDL